MTQMGTIGTGREAGREAHREGICVYKELIHFLYSRN